MEIRMISTALYGSQKLFRQLCIGLPYMLIIVVGSGCSSGDSSGDGNAQVGPDMEPEPGPENPFIGRFNVLVDGFDVVENPGDAEITNFDPQLLLRIENQENSINCSATIEQLVSIQNIDSLFDQYVANSTNANFVLINDFSREGIPAKEAIVESTLSNGLQVTSIVQVYFMDESITDYGIASAFYFDCVTPSELFSANELQIGNFFGSIDFLRQQDASMTDLGNFTERSGMWHINSIGLF